MRRRGIGALVALALVVVGLIAARASASPYTGQFGPTIYNNSADVNGDGVVNTADDSNALYGDTSIINGGLDCDAWAGVNDGAEGDGSITGADNCTLLGFDGTNDGTTIEVLGGSFASRDGAPIPNGTPLPTVFPNVGDEANGDVGDSVFGWQAINGRVDSNGNDTIDSEDCTIDLVGAADILSSNQQSLASCGTALPPVSDGNPNGLVDLSGDSAITAADTCVNGCFFGRDVASGLVQVESAGATPTPTPTPTPTASPTPTPGPGNSVLMISDGGTRVSPSQDCHFIVSLLPASTGMVQVNFVAAATNSKQIAAASGTLVFAPGETAKTVEVDVLKRRRKTGTVEVTLSGASGATISDGVGRCTIRKRARRR